MPKLVQGSQVGQNCLQEKDGHKYKCLESSFKYPFSWDGGPFFGRHTFVIIL
jgi:hypothetical protein